VRRAWAAAALTLALGADGRAWAADPYVEAAAMPKGDQALILDVVFGRLGAAERLSARMTADPRPTPDLAERAWPLLCEDDYRTGRYRAGAASCGQAAAIGAEAHVLEIVQLLADQPPVKAEGAARVILSPGGRIAVRSGDFAGEGIVDTGAQISVMMQSVALAAHVRLLGVSHSVETPTADIQGQIGMIPEVRIGRARLQNLPVLVLPDDQLVIANGSVRLPFILGLDGLAAFERIAWLDHGRALALGAAAPVSAPGAAPLTWHPLGVAAPVDGVEGRRAAHLDSGANLSYLTETGLGLLPPQERTRLGASRRWVGGVGGAVEEDIERLPRATLSLAGHSLTLVDVDVAMESDTGEVARIGEDVLGRFSAVVLDFIAMKISVKP